MVILELEGVFNRGRDCHITSFDTFVSSFDLLANALLPQVCKLPLFSKETSLATTV